MLRSQEGDVSNFLIHLEARTILTDTSKLEGRRTTAKQILFHVNNSKAQTSNTILMKTKKSYMHRT